MGALGHWLVVQPHRNAQCFIHAAHVIFRNAPGALPQAAFIQCANLFGQHNAVFSQAAAVGPHADMGGQAVLSCLLVMAAAITVGLCRLPISF